MGNKINDEQPVKKIDRLTFNIVVNKVNNFLNSGNEAVAILQEIPFKCNTNGFKEHILFRKFLEFFPDDKYDMYYNISSEKQIKMTVVLAKKDRLRKFNLSKKKKN